MESAPVITLTTDFGHRDYYAGALKGALLRACPFVQVVDISHAIAAYDIVEAAFVVRNAFPEFPDGAIHLIGVNCVYDRDYRFVAVRHQEHFFVAPDNGVLSLLFDQLPEADIRTLPVAGNSHFPVKHAFVEAAAHLGSRQPFEHLGIPGAPLLQRISLQPVITATRIRGTVIHIDTFENVIVNIRRDTFETAAKGRPFSLFFKRNDPINRLSGNYSDVLVGEPLCLFNSAGYLEIAVNLGRAASLLGLKVEDVVELVFEGN
ncbi:MAG: SAM-dependent chlorinase/fluorinase [Saprospiraceae bacterium]|nr:SAM-dependent chlorinase/fluorinase [Saprospiraceae bacterium]